MFCLNLNCLFCMPYVQHILLWCLMTQKRCLNKTKKIFFHLNKLESFEFFLNRATALLALLPNWHIVITCTSSAYKSKRMDANKIKLIDHIGICHTPPGCNLPPNYKISLFLALQVYDYDQWPCSWWSSLLVSLFLM